MDAALVKNHRSAGTSPVEAHCHTIEFGQHTLTASATSLCAAVRLSFSPHQAILNENCICLPVVLVRVIWPAVEFTSVGLLKIVRFPTSGIEKFGRLKILKNSALNRMDLVRSSSR